MTHPTAYARLAGTLATVLVAGAALAGCSGSDDAGPEPKPVETSAPSASGSGSSAPADDVPAGLERFYGQKLTWKDCRQGDQCTKVEVPLDYTKPDGRTIELSVLKVPAQEQDGKVGALLVNPGGPGASGVDYAASAETYFNKPILDHFDIVGFDPRGVGRSDPIDCLTDAQLDQFAAADPDPDDVPEQEESDALLRQFGEGCLARSGNLTRHMSTVEAARDMDVLRGVLKQPKMLYFGASYGTFLGGTYADLFPDKVGRMVLDGAIDPTVSLVQGAVVQAKGFETALRAYVAACVDKGDCFLGDSVDAGIKRIQDLLDETDTEPLPTSEGRQLTEGLAVLGIWAPLYNRDYWFALDQGLKAAFNGDGDVLLKLADAYLNRGPDGYNDNSSEALYAVNCLDRDEWVDPGEVAKVEGPILKASPTFGRLFAWGLTACGSWSVHSGNKPKALRATGSAPIMVVGTSRDPATPLSWAEGLVKQLDNAVLVKRDGDGHTGYKAGNSCVDEAVENYLVAGVVPKATVSC
jgi:pimeloyl-ACP methyl ester carboxylesterase